MGRFNVTIRVMVRKKILSLTYYGPVTDPVTDPVTMLSRSSHGVYRASLLSRLHLIPPLDWSNQYSLPAGPMGGVMWRAGQHIIDSTTYNFGQLVVPAANFAGPLDGQSDINIRTACRGYGRDGLR